MAKQRTVLGTIQRIGIEGGLLALVTDSGEAIELLDPPSNLVAGARAEVVFASRDADVSIGMIGRAAKVVRARVVGGQWKVD